MKRIAAAAALAFLLVPAAAGQTTKPVRYTWIATSCTTWNCAAAAMILANGDKHVIVLPTGQNESPWLVLRRVEEGSLYIPEDEPFRCEEFDTLVDATLRYTAMNPCHAPIVLSVPDGRAVMLSLSKCPDTPSRQRAVR
jgi:hypothetical protein